MDGWIQNFCFLKSSWLVVPALLLRHVQDAREQQLRAWPRASLPSEQPGDWRLSGKEFDFFSVEAAEMRSLQSLGESSFIFYRAIQISLAMPRQLEALGMPGRLQANGTVVMTMTWYHLRFI